MSYQLTKPFIQIALVRSYYDPRGLDYNVGRINMGGCDFSVRGYTYLDTEGDILLETFSLQEEDLVYKVDMSSKEVLENFNSAILDLELAWATPC